MIQSNDVEEQFTGCLGDSSYKDFARSQGYIHVEPLNWSSSAGDWEFLISKDGIEWRILSQSNNFPRPGFSHVISAEQFHGTFAEVVEKFS